MGEDELNAMQTAIDDMNNDNLDVSVLENVTGDDVIQFNFDMHSTGYFGNDQLVNNQQTSLLIRNDELEEELEINSSGLIRFNNNELNIFELVNKLELLEYKIEQLMELLPKKLTGNILRSKNNIV